MTFFGFFILFFGFAICTTILIVELIYPKSLKKPNGTPFTRKQVVFSCIAGILGCFLITSMIEGLAHEETKDKNVKMDDLGVMAESPNPINPQPTKKPSNTSSLKSDLADFGITSDRFTQNYNTLISELDKDLLLKGVVSGRTVQYLPRHNNVAMGGVINDNGNLRGVILTINPTLTEYDNLLAITMAVTASNAVQGSTEKTEITRSVIQMISKITKNKDESQKAIIGNASYSVIYSQMTGLIFTIDAI